MKRVITLAITVLVLGTLVMAPMTTLAGEGCGAKKAAGDAEATTISSKHDHSSTGTSFSSGKGHCSRADMAECAAKMGMTLEECQTLCSTGNYTMVNMSIQGMTCGGCENRITACLEEIPGVVKVGRISHKEGSAFVLVDPKKVKNETLVKAVSSTGYQAEVIPAVARTTTVGDTKTAGAARGCGMKGKKGSSSASAATCAASALATASSRPDLFSNAVPPAFHPII